MPAESSMYFVYRLTLPNGKKYIGYTSSTVEQRFKWHWNARKRLKTPLHKCLALLYSPEQVIQEVVWDGGDKTHALFVEIETIASERTLVTQEGLNVTPGGEAPPAGFGGAAWKDNKSDEEILAINKKKGRAGVDNPFYGKKHSHERLASMVCSRRNAGGYKNAAEHLSTPEKIQERSFAVRKALANQLGFPDDVSFVTEIVAKIKLGCGVNCIARKLHTNKTNIRNRLRDVRAGMYGDELRSSIGGERNASSN